MTRRIIAVESYSQHQLACPYWHAAQELLWIKRARDLGFTIWEEYS